MADKKDNNKSAKHSDYAALINNGKMAEIWKQITKHHVQQRSECIHTNYVPPKADKSYGHTQTKFENVKYYCHIIACMKQCERSPEKGEEASHLCGNGHCVNPKHLWFESGHINKTRICCKHYMGKKISNLPDNVVIYYNCPHYPRCIVSVDTVDSEKEDDEKDSSE